jgi:hypothetical protein
MRPPVCITGMHRSGTSMMAMLLHACGLRIGSPRDFAPADVDNRLGYWEDLRFVRLNDALLARAGGTWDRPPRPITPPGKALRDRWLAYRGRRLLNASASDLPWGWKDPRAALTLPFWTSLSPDLRVVICLRHPAVVQESLMRRTHWKSREGEALWLTYNERLLDAVPRERRIIVANDAVVNDPVAALGPVLEFAGLPRERLAASAVHALVRPDLQRAAASARQDCAPQAERLYETMLEEAENARRS